MKLLNKHYRYKYLFTEFSKYCITKLKNRETYLYPELTPELIPKRLKITEKQVKSKIKPLNNILKELQKLERDIIDNKSNKKLDNTLYQTQGLIKVIKLYEKEINKPYTPFR